MGTTLVETPNTFTFQIRPAGGPIESFQPDKMSPQHCKLFEMVGRIVVLWTGIERDISFIFGRFHELDNDEMEIPKRFRRHTKSLAAKLDFIDYVVSEVREVNHLQEKWRALRAHIATLSDARGKLVHWSNIGFDTVGDELFMKFRDNERMTEEDRTEHFSLNDLAMAANRMGNIGVVTMFFRSELIQMAFGPQSFRAVSIKPIESAQ